VALTWSRVVAWDKADWRQRAACRNLSPDLFFPVGSSGAALAQIEKAKQICRSCPSRAQCLEFALTSNQESGVWGGTSEEERRLLRKRWLAGKSRIARTGPGKF
jgi:WhiB family redox-sensing transcriptional regulator